MSSEDKEPDSLAVRSQRHRQRRKLLETQLAIAVAKLVCGTDLGDHKLVVKDYLKKFSEQPDVEDDQMRILDLALDKLNRSRLRL